MLIGKRFLSQAVLASITMMSACAPGTSGSVVNEALTPACAHSHPIMHRDYNYLVFFDKDSALITHLGEKVLEDLAQRWKRQRGHFMELSGHTDGLEAQFSSKSLALDRANATKTFLIAQGLDADRIIARGFGASRKLVPTEDSEPQNRRVEFGPFFLGGEDDQLAALRQVDKVLCKIWVKDHCLTSSRGEHAGAAACNEALDMASGAS